MTLTVTYKVYKITDNPWNSLQNLAAIHFYDRSERIVMSVHISRRYQKTDVAKPGSNYRRILIITASLFVLIFLLSASLSALGTVIVEDTSSHSSTEASATAGTAISAESDSANEAAADSGTEQAATKNSKGARTARSGGSPRDLLNNPIPSDATYVSNWSQLRVAMATPSVSYIVLTDRIQRTGGVGNTIDLPVITRNLTIHGQGNLIDARNNGATTAINRNLFKLGPAANGTTLNLVDLYVHRPNADNTPVIAYVRSTANSQSTTSSARESGSSAWTVNLVKFSSGEVFAQSCGLINVSDGSVHFWDKNNWTMNGNNVLINAREISLNGGTTVLANQNTGSSSQIVQMYPSTLALGISLSARDGAQVYMTTNASTQVVRAESRGNVMIEVTDRSLLNIEGFGAGTGTEGGTMSIEAASGGYLITKGGVLRAHSKSVNNGQSAIVQQIPNGRFTVDGEGSTLDVQSWGANNGMGATLRFRAVGNQQFLVSNGARVNVIKHKTNNSNDAAALRFGTAQNNTFEITSGGQVHIENFGSGRGSGPINPGTNNSDGHDAAVEYADSRFGFNVNGENSAVEIIAHRGAAINARSHGNGTIKASDGAIFLARGETTSPSSSVIRASGGNNHFTMESPYFYDFINTRPNGGRVFDLGTSSGNTFTSLNSDVSVWRIANHPWYGNPERSWTLIDYSLSGTQLRQVTSNDPTFTSYYNSLPNHGSKIDTYTRITGNNAKPEIRGMLDLTNADKYVRAQGIVPEGLNKNGHPFYTGEAWGTFVVTPADGSAEYEVRSADTFDESLVRSYLEETLYEAEQNVKTVAGTLKLRYADGRFLRAGDTYTLTEVWRAHNPETQKRHEGKVGIPTAATVRDVVPPVPAEVDRPVIQIWDTQLSGNWSLADKYDNGPVLGSGGIKAYVQNEKSASQPLAGTGSVNEDGTWSFTLDSASLQPGDMIYIVLIDDQGNENPLESTPRRDMVLPPASIILVAEPGTIPYLVSYYFDGLEDRNLMYVGSVTDPGPGQSVPVQLGVDFPHAPADKMFGYRLDRTEPEMPAAINFDHTRIQIHYVSDEAHTASVKIQYSFDGVHDPAYDRTINPQILSIVGRDDVALKDVPRGYVPASENYITPSLPAPARDLDGSTVKVAYVTTLHNVSISKEIVDDNPDPEQEFTFTIYLSDDKGNPLPAGTRFTYTLHSSVPVLAGEPADPQDDTEPPITPEEPEIVTGNLVLAGPSNGLAGGRYSFTLKHGQTLVIEEVNSRHVIRVVQDGVEGYTSSFLDSYYPGQTEQALDTDLREMTNEDRNFSFQSSIPEEEQFPTPSGLFTGSGYIIPSLLATGMTTAVLTAGQKRLKLEELRPSPPTTGN